MIRRAVLGVASAFLLVGGAGVVPASADDPTPILPPGVTAPPAPTGSSTSGPTYVITPGVGGSELPDPSDPKAVEEAKKADSRRGTTGEPAAGKDDPRTGTGTGTRTGKPARVPAGSAVVGAQEPLATVVGEEPVGLVWRGIAATVVMLVLFEITVVRRSLLQRRRWAVTAG